MIGSQVVIIGLARGRIELVHLLRSRRELFSQLSTPLVVIVLSAVVDSDIPGGTVAMSQLFIAGGISTMIVQAGLMTVPQVLATEREDGTLLRLRTVPGGMTAYLIGRTFVVVVTALAGVLLIMLGGVPAAGLRLPADAADWLTLAWVFVLGLTAVVPIGAAIGAVLPNPREALGFMLIPVVALMTVSGLFFPVTVLPEPVRQVAQIFPVKWIGQGVRSALLPDSALTAETGHDWQHPQIFLVTVAWAAVGFLVAPRLLGRVSRGRAGNVMKEEHHA